MIRPGQVLRLLKSVRTNGVAFPSKTYAMRSRLSFIWSNLGLLEHRHSLNPQSTSVLRYQRLPVASHFGKTGFQMRCRPRACPFEYPQ